MFQFKKPASYKTYPRWKSFINQVNKGVSQGIPVVVKIIKHGSENAFKRIIKEAKIIKRCKHENIIELLGICTNEPAIM